MTLASQLTSDERQLWEDFCQRLGATLRSQTIIKVLDDCASNPRLSAMCAQNSNRLLNSELTILVLHRDRKAMMA